MNKSPFTLDDIVDMIEHNEGDHKSLLRKLQRWPQYALPLLARLTMTHKVERENGVISSRSSRFIVDADCLLNRIGGRNVAEVLALFKSEDPIVRATAADLVASIPVSEGLSYVKNAAGSDSDDRVVAYALRAIGRLGTVEQEPFLCSFLESSNPRIKQSALLALIDCRGRVPVDRLRQLSVDRDVRVRQSAILLAGKSGATELIPYLHDIVERQTSDLWAAIVALGDLQATSVVQELNSIIYHPDSSVRAILAMSLGKIGTSESVELLLRLAQDSSPRVRVAVCEALAHVGNAISKSVLVSLRKSNEPEVANAAREALKEIRRRTVVEVASVT